MTTQPILIVEDNPDDEKLILRSLRKANLTNPLATVHDGAEALDYLFKTGTYTERPTGSPNLVVLDIKLPKVNGLEVLDRMRSAETTRYIPTVILTSSDEQEELLQSYRLGANSYVRKPLEFGEFAYVVAQLGLYWTLLNQAPAESAEYG